MRWVLLLIVVVPGQIGCTHAALQRDTARTTNTLADLQFRQVLDNLARFQANPDTMPSFAVTTAGTVSVNDQASAGFSPTYAPTLTFSQQGGGPVILQMLLPSTGQRSVTENWSLTPVTESDNLRRLRCAYRLAVMGEATPDYEFCRQQMKEFFAGESVADSYPPRGWYGVGGKKEVPREACYVGHYAGTYVWVLPGGVNDLALFTMGALDLATGKPRTPQRNVVRKYKGEPKPENLVETQVTSNEDDEAGREAVRGGRVPLPPRSRTTAPGGFNPGLLVVPR